MLKNTWLKIDENKYILFSEFLHCLSIKICACNTTRKLLAFFITTTILLEVGNFF